MTKPKTKRSGQSGHADQIDRKAAPTDRVLIVSDIHSNWEALTAVLEDAKGRYDRICCLGDIVGYGADPNAVVDWARANVQSIVRGNHDKACSGVTSADDFNWMAHDAVMWTRTALTAENAAYLRELPAGPVAVIEKRTATFHLVHGSPADEDQYLCSAMDVGQRTDLKSKLTFFGHTHDQGGFCLTRGTRSRVSTSDTLHLAPANFYLINPGSVGQPRDGDPHAAYAIYTPAARTIEYRRVAYDVKTAAAKINNAGLPRPLAQRLFQGH